MADAETLAYIDALRKAADPKWHKFTEVEVRALGLDWPPPRHWRKRLRQQIIEDAVKMVEIELTRE